MDKPKYDCRMCSHYVIVTDDSHGPTITYRCGAGRFACLATHPRKSPKTYAEFFGCDRYEVKMLAPCRDCGAPISSGLVCRDCKEIEIALKLDRAKQRKKQKPVQLSLLDLLEPSSESVPLMPSGVALAEKPKLELSSPARVPVENYPPVALAPKHDYLLGQRIELPTGQSVVVIQLGDRWVITIDDDGQQWAYNSCVQSVVPYPPAMWGSSLG